MGKKFEIGKTYLACDGYYIKVTRRTDKTIWVDNDQTTWRMRIRYDQDGNECAIDSLRPKKVRDRVTYRAIKELR